MAEITLTEIAESAHKAYAPVEVGNGISVSAVRDIKNEKYHVEGSIDKAGKNIGRYVMSEEQGRMFINVQLDGLDRNDGRNIVDTISSLILQLIPENVVE